MKVAKFGGSSLANATQFKKVSDIIQSDEERKFIVVSAPGKRHDEDFKVTDLLIQLFEAYINDNKYKSYLITITDRFKTIIEDLNLDRDLLTRIEDDIIDTLESDLSDRLKLNAIKAIGENSSALILSAYLNSLGMTAKYVNPKEAGIIVEDLDGGAQILDESFDIINQLTHEEGIIVIPGFFGYTKEGNLATFSRGGSDITGAIIASGVDASLYENFTDVDSVYSVNPNIVDNPKEITTLTYREMRELSYAGFSVFHDEALIPAVEKEIPVCIKNTNNPSAPGTMIVANKEIEQNCVVGVASDTGFISLYVSKFLMNREIGFVRKLLQILEEEKISFEHAPSGIDDISIIIHENQLDEKKEFTIMSRINNELKPDVVRIDRDLALVMVVGEGMKETIGMAQKATQALGEAKVNLEMMNQGSSEVSMMFGIKSNGLHRAIKSLYKAFFVK